MYDDPLDHFEYDLKRGTRLCLLPIGNIDPPDLIEISEELLLYPKNSVSPFDIRVVSFPAYEYSEVDRRVRAISPQFLKLQGYALAWFGSTATSVTLDEFFGHALLAFEVRMDWYAFLSPDTHDVHLGMMKHAIDVASELMAVAGFDIGCAAPKGKRPGRLGRLQDSIFDAALFYTLEDHESYIIGGKIDRNGG